MLNVYYIVKKRKKVCRMRYKYKNTEYSEVELLCIAQKEFNNKLSITTLDARLKRGWDVTRAISTPVRARAKKGSPERTQASLRRAHQKYIQSHPEKAKIYRTRSYARTFIRKYANLQDLDNCEQKIKKRLAEL